VTGLLKISGEEGEARIHFQRGKIAAAEAGELSGLPALWSALGDGRGDFVLTVDPSSGEPSESSTIVPIVASVRGLLIDMAWASDESDEP
jgi:hypothetical protein